MSMLTEKLPEKVFISGKYYPVCTDFSVWIRFSQLAFSGKSDAVSVAQMLILVFKELPQAKPEEIFSALLDFYSFQKSNTATTQEKSSKRVFDYDADAGYIYAAFLQQYNIDLGNVNMHWWTFKTLFDSLSEDTHFGKILQYRCTDTSQIKDKEMKKFYQKMKRAYALPDNRSDEEKERDFAEGLSGLF